MLNTAAAVIVIALAIFLLGRRAEARLVLLAATTALFLLARRFPELPASMAAELTNAKTVIPICASLGFAYVLRLTECDRHLVRLLLRPLDVPAARALLIPGVIVSGYVVNMAIVSQSGAAAIVGSIAIPLLLSKGVSRATAGSLLLLGTSMGGELFNPGAVETVTLAKLTGLSPILLAQRSVPLNLLACGSALALYWLLALRWERNSAERDTGRPSDAGADAKPSEEPGVSEQAQGISVAKALVPFIPLVLLFTGAHLPVMRLFHDHVTILVAMIIGSIAAAATAPRKVGALAASFFEGAGFAYTHVISVTVCATLFAQGIIANGLVKNVVGALAGRPGPALFASLSLPWALAALSGSGAGSASSMMTALIPGAATLRLDPGQMGILSAMGSHFGRTMSPAAAVAILCATLVVGRADVREIGAMTLTVTKRVAPALCFGGAVMYVAALLGVGR